MKHIMKPPMRGFVETPPMRGFVETPPTRGFVQTSKSIYLFTFYLMLRIYK